jgi:bacteriocin biosynthesis cyclodehydratase domain-containing protein
MVLELDPRFPRIWRSPDTLQFGVDVPCLVLRPVSNAEERMIAALSDGVSLSGLRMIARRARADDRSVDSLLERLAPVLVRTSGPAADAAPGTTPLVVLDGEGATASHILGLLRGAGAEVGSGLEWSDPLVDRADFAVIIGSFAIEPGRHSKWLRRDVPHLPVVFSDGGVTVGPLVRPGRGPCVRCVDLHRTDRDPAWPAMATQLYARDRPLESAIVRDAVAAAVAATVLAHLSGDAGTSASEHPSAVARRFDPSSGEWTDQMHMPHKECGCLALPLTPSEAPATTRRGLLADGQERGARPGSARAGAPRDDPVANPGGPS